jgi:hypothetical protein
MLLARACHLPILPHLSVTNEVKARSDALKGMLKKISLSPERFKAEYVYVAE